VNCIELFETEEYVVKECKDKLIIDSKLVKNNNNKICVISNRENTNKFITLFVLLSKQGFNVEILDNYKKQDSDNVELLIEVENDCIKILRRGRPLTMICGRYSPTFILCAVDLIRHIHLYLTRCVSHSS